MARVEENSIIAFEKDFLRFMLSDSASAVLINVKPLNSLVVPYFINTIEYALSRHKTDLPKVRYVIPHISSIYFYDRLSNEIESYGIPLTKDKLVYEPNSCGQYCLYCCFCRS